MASAGLTSRPSADGGDPDTRDEVGLSAPAHDCVLGSADGPLILTDPIRHDHADTAASRRRRPVVRERKYG
ncbi:hypothetical protein [Streptomyces sp. NPDC058812]|uniref:hypothetical protein n=1 Tax=unclassified Streptomyces TaxID=2593676 RepID=UPI0036C5572C